jgi:hypothetical protein
MRVVRHWCTHARWTLHFGLFRIRRSHHPHHHADQFHARQRAVARLSPMHPAVSLIGDNVAKHHQLFAPLLFIVLASVANVHEPVQHSLLVATAAWAAIWIPTLFKAGILANTSSKRRNTCWVAGACLALACVCDRAACDKEGTWATKVHRISEVENMN